jgi:2-amino-4-hydroxy-6-hydroxymethyldihydropteridine diphosphokinase
MTRAFIGIGSNIDPAENVRAAIRSLAQQTRLVGISMVYCTDALDRPEQPPYYNCVVAIETEVPPAEVKHGILHPIENSLGRKRTADRYAPRTIDLDLIVYGRIQPAHRRNCGKAAAGRNEAAEGLCQAVERRNEPGQVERVLTCPVFSCHSFLENGFGYSGHAASRGQCRYQSQRGRQSGRRCGLCQREGSGRLSSLPKIPLC